MNAIIDPVAMVTMQPFAKGLDYLMGIPSSPNVTDPATAFSNFAQSALLGGSNIQSLNPDAFKSFEAGQQGRAGANPDTTPWGEVFAGAAPTEAQPSIESYIPGGRETNFDYNVQQQQAPIDVELVSPSDPALTNAPNPLTEPAPADAPPADAPPADARPADARPADASPANAPSTSAFISGGRPTDFNYTPQAPPQAPPSLVEQAQSAPSTGASIPGSRTTDFNYMRSSTDPSLVETGRPGGTGTTDMPVVGPPADAAPGQPGEPDHGEEGEPETTAPPDQRGRLGEPTTGTQNTPVVSPRVIQEQAGQWRNRPINERLHGILTQAAEQAGVVVHVGSGGQIATRSPATYRQVGGWTGSVRHNHGNAADVRLEQNGRFLSFNNPQDRVVMENFVREAARLGATGQGAGMAYMRENTIHVGFGTSRFWNADNPGSRALRQAWSEGLRGPANRPPADIPGRQVRPAAPPPGVPMPPARPADAPQPDVARPPADIPPPEVPAARPPVLDPAPSPVAPRPPADIPAPAPFLAPPQRGQLDRAVQTQNALNLIKQSTAKLTTASGQAEFNAAGVVAAKGLAAAGVPLDMARSLMTKSAYEGAEKVGYGPSSMGWSLYKSSIDGGIAAALQGYHPAKPGEVQGPQGFQPDAPATPGRQGAFGAFPQYADLSQSRPSTPEDYGREGDVGAASPYFGATTPTVPQLSPMVAPPAPPSPPYQPPPGPVYTPGGPGMFNPFRGNEAALPGDPRGQQQASLLDFLQNFNPISTAEARSGRGQSYPVPRGSTRDNPHFTFYGPGPGGKMEGGFETSRPNQAGTISQIGTLERSLMLARLMESNTRLITCAVMFMTPARPSRGGRKK
jgi:hypothetical protein